MPLLFSHLNFFQTFTWNESFAKFANFAKFVIFVKPAIINIPLLSSCLHFCQTFINICQICHVKIPLFVISFVLGQTLELSIFAEILRFRLNLPFSYNRRLPSFPSLSPHLSFCQTFDGFLPNPPFSQFANFVESPTVNIAGLHLTSRRLCWWSRTKAFVSSVNQTLFSC